MKKFLLLLILIVLAFPLKANDLHFGNTCINSFTKFFMNNPFSFWFQVIADYTYLVTPAEWFTRISVHRQGVEQPVYQTTVPGVQFQNAGESHTLTVDQTFTPTVPGNYYVQFQIFYTGDINNSNNTQSYTVPGYDRPDPISNFWPTSEPPVVLQGGTFTATWNNGSTPITSTIVTRGNTPETSYPGLGIPVSSTPSLINYCPITNLQENTTVYVTVTQDNPAGERVNGPQLVKTAGTSPPPPTNKATPASPLNGSTVDVNPNPTLTWLPPTNTTGLNQYGIYLGPTAESVNPSLGPATATITFPASSYTLPDNFTTPNSSLFWSVQSIFNDGSKTNSDIWHFNFNNIYNYDPRNVLFPAENDLIPPGPTPVFTHSAFENIMTGSVTSPNLLDELFISPTLPGLNSSTTPAASQPAIAGKNSISLSQLNFSTTYYSRFAINNGGTRSYGGTRTFRTQAPGSVFGTAEIRPDVTKPETLPAQNVLVTYTGSVTYNNLPFGTYTRTTQTGSNGGILIMDLIGGNYTVAATLPGHRVHSPAAGKYEGILNPGQTKQGFDFTFVPLSNSIQGIKWSDEDGDGIKDPTEPGIQDWQIYLNGTTSSGQTIQQGVKTDAAGKYKFENLQNGTYQITEETKTGWKLSFPVGGIHSVTITSGQDIIDKNFGNMAPGIIEGIKFFDENGNGKKDLAEIGINGVKIEIYKAGTLVKTLTTTTKDANGDSKVDPITECGIFSFADLEVGDYVIKEVVPAGFTKTNPTGDSFAIQLKPGQKIDTLKFGNRATALDFGDAPDPFISTGCFIAQCYPTRLPIGARHVATGIKIGKQRDVEPDGLQTNLSDGDDKNGIDDEDGISITKYNIGSAGEVKVEIVGDAKDLPCYLYAWIDFNRDGYFGFGSKNPEETIIKTKIEQTGISTYTFNIPAGTIRNVSARFRISSNEESIKLPYGLALDGEVEDYNVDNYIVSIKNYSGSEIPTQYVLYQNYPNPFNPATTITYDIPKESHVTIKIFDALGNEISILVNGKKSAGKYQAQFDGSNLPSGIYFYQMRAESFMETKKFLLVK